jgi:pimeloyl-ACP methyl ester carboxylesterase
MMALASSGLPIPAAAAFLTLDGSRIYYEESGPADAPTVVLLHDGLLDSATWDQVWPQLVRRHHVVRYDRRGMGRSDPPRAAFIPTEDLRALLDSLGIASATLVGSSSGSGLAIDFAIRHPDRVDRLVLAGPVLHGMATSGHFLERGARNNAPLQRNDVRGAARNWAADPYQIAGPNQAAREWLFQELAKRPQNLRYDGRLETHFMVPAVARLGEIRAPTLILVGESDIPDVQAYAGAVEAGIWGAKREVIAGSGHLLQLEKPDLFARRVMDFIADDPVTRVTSAALEGLVGTFAKALYGFDAQFSISRDQLMLHVPTERDLPLFPSSDSTFYVLSFGGCRFAFKRGPDGRARSVEVVQGGQRTLAPRLN